VGRHHLGGHRAARNAVLHTQSPGILHRQRAKCRRGPAYAARLVASAPPVRTTSETSSRPCGTSDRPPFDRRDPPGGCRRPDSVHQRCRPSPLPKADLTFALQYLFDQYPLARVEIWHPDSKISCQFGPVAARIGVDRAESCNATDTSNSGFCNATDTCNPFRSATRPTRARCRSRGRGPRPHAARRVSMAGGLAESVVLVILSAIQRDAC